MDYKIYSYLFYYIIKLIDDRKDKNTRLTEKCKQQNEKMNELKQELANSTIDRYSITSGI